MKKFLLYLIIFIIIFIGFQRLVQPKYQTDLVEGSMTAEYYQSPKNHQIIFLGDCEVYSNFSPITLFNEYGYTSYIRGNSKQLIHQSYYLLKETLKYEKPKIVIYNVNALRYTEKDKNEAYNHLMIDNMKNSNIKYALIKNSMVDNESWLDYIFPLFRYHSRLLELTKEDWQYYFKKKQITHDGYLMRVDSKPVTTFYQGKPLGSYKFAALNMEYLDKIRKLCVENKIKLLLVKAPSTYPYWYDEYDKQVKDYAKKYNLDYLNFKEKVNDIGIDYQKDTYDAGLHLNVSGAEKLAIYLGNYLKDNYDLEDRRNDDKINKIYKEKTKYYNYIKEQQYTELKKYKKIVMYGG